MPTVIASNTTSIVDGSSANNSLQISVTSDGTPVTPDSLTITAAPASGTASVVGSTILYTPNAGYYGPDSVSYTATVSGTTSNTATISLTVLSDDCWEYGRASRNYVTPYNLSRPQIVKLRRFSSRCFIADYSGAIVTGRTITSARWDCTGPWAVFMKNPRIINGQKKVAIDVDSNFAGWSGLLSTVTLDNGETFNSEFSVTVSDAPVYPGATYATVTGPFTLTFTVV